MECSCAIPSRCLKTRGRDRVFRFTEGDQHATLEKIVQGLQSRLCEPYSLSW